jgi:hypothetical protein
VLVLLSIVLVLLRPPLLLPPAREAAVMPALNGA